MKQFIKLFLFLSLFLVGCNNPISLQIDKEGDETRAELQTEVALAEQHITKEVKDMLTEMKVEINGTIVSVFEYLTMVIKNDQ